VVGGLEHPEVAFGFANHALDAHLRAGLDAGDAAAAEED
jgi:hypothetical protein